MPRGPNSFIKRFAFWKVNQKNRARYLLNRAIAFGWLIRQPCEVCGTTKTESHHVNYAEPYNVRWLCKYHHCRADRLEEYCRGLLAEDGQTQISIIF